MAVARGLTQAGHLSETQLDLLLSHLPVGLSMADENDIMCFWAGATFVACNPSAVGHELHACHPKRARQSLDSLLDSLKAGARDVVDRVERSSLGMERFIYTALRDNRGLYRGVLQTVLPVAWVEGGGTVPKAGCPTRDQLALVLAHMPIALSFADESGVLLFWAGEAFSACDPGLIGRDLVQGHAQQAQPAVAKLLKDLASGAKDEVSTQDGSERIIYTALRDADGAYRGVLETVVPTDRPTSADDAGEA
jgi:DUF438 domain-containing protein